MNTKLKITLLILPFLITMGESHAEELLRVFDHGTDGDVRYYSVVCPSGKRTAVSNHYEKGEICAMPVKGREEICRRDWDVDNAAREACK